VWATECPIRRRNENQNPVLTLWPRKIQNHHSPDTEPSADPRSTKIIWTPGSRKQWGFACSRTDADGSYGQYHANSYGSKFEAGHKATDAINVESGVAEGERNRAASLPSTTDHAVHSLPVPALDHKNPFLTFRRWETWHWLRAALRWPCVR
jgi:hypothetical protein